jgi:hypothetical protein
MPMCTPEYIPVVISCVGIIIAVFTLFAINRQARIANDTLLATFRPQLIVRKVYLRSGTQISTMGVPDTDPWMVVYAIANIGGSRATLKSGNFEASSFEDGLPANLPYKDREFVEPISIQPGEEKDFSVRIGENLTNYFRMLGTKSPYDMSHQKIGHVYFWGRAQYSDDRGFIRDLAICRHYKTDTGKFMPVEDADYEYAD